MDALEAAKTLVRAPVLDTKQAQIIVRDHPDTLAHRVHNQTLFHALASRSIAEGLPELVSALATALQTCRTLAPLLGDFKALLRATDMPMSPQLPQSVAERRLAEHRGKIQAAPSTVDASPSTQDSQHTLSIDTWQLEELESGINELGPQRAAIGAALDRLAHIVGKPGTPPLQSRKNLALFVLECLQSSDFSVRLAAANLLGAWAGAPGLATDTLQFVEGLARREVSLDTQLHAWAEAAANVPEDALAAPLLYLVQGLRKVGPGAWLAAHYIAVVARRRGVSPWQLCAPFWSVISIAVVREAETNPEFVERFCTVVAVPQTDLLMRTAHWTLPYLCSVGNMSVVSLVSDATARSPATLVLHHAPEIIALLLAQDAAYPLVYAQKRFMSLVPAFRNLKWGAVLEPNLKGVVFELLKLAGDSGRDVVPILREIAGDLGPSDLQFLLNKFTNTMKNVAGRQAWTTKRACVRGLGVLIEQYPMAAASVVRQIIAFLQAALETPLLVVDALRVWRMLMGLDAEIVESILDLTFSLVNQEYLQWPADAKDAAESLVKYTWEVHGQDDVLLQRRGRCPSTPFDDEAQKYHSTEPLQRLEQILGRNDMFNRVVARQAVQDIQECVLAAQHVPTSLAAKLTRHMLDLSGRFRDVLPCTDIPGLCARVLGQIGALDPYATRLPPPAAPQPPVPAELLDPEPEAAAFAAHILQHHLLGAFESAADPAKQEYLALAIQELLQLIGDSSLGALEQRFGSAARSLEPFLTSQYRGIGRDGVSHRTYPIFNAQISYSTWLEALAADQMCRVTREGQSRRLWGVLRLAARGDPALWPALLGPAALCAVAESPENLQVFLEEVSAVLYCKSQPGDDVTAFHERVFAVLDYFATWLRVRRVRKMSCLGVDAFLAQIPPELMARRSEECRAYPRAIRYYEQTLRAGTGTQIDSPPVSEEEIWESLRRMYADMQDVDALEGVSSRFAAMSVEQQVLSHRATQQWDAALACYDVLGRWADADRLACLQSSGRERDVLGELATLVNAQDDSRLAEIGVECGWMVADWNAVSRWARETSPESVSGLLGRGLLAFRERDIDAFLACLTESRRILARELPDPKATTSFAEFRHVSICLHALADLESIAAVIAFCGETPPSQREVLNVLDTRLERVGADFAARRFLLGVRRAAFALHPDQAVQVAQTYLIGAQDARERGGNSRLALEDVLQARELDHPLAGTEYARLLWSRGDVRQALQMLKAELPEAFFGSRDRIKPDPEAAKPALLYVTWLEDAAEAGSSDLAEYYSKCIAMAPQWAEAQYWYGKLCASRFHAAAVDSPDASTAALSVLGAYTKALELEPLGEHVGECLPKLLTIWLDTAADQRVGGRARKAFVQRANRIVSDWSRAVQAAVLYQALPQLLARLNLENNKGAVDAALRIVRKVIERYPEQALWLLLGVTEGPGVSNIKKERATGLLQDLLGHKRLSKRVQQAVHFVRALVGVCNAAPPANTTTCTLAQLNFDLEAVPCDLAVPVQRRMQDPMATELVTVYKMHNHVTIQSSLQRPKRVAMYGTDGCEYRLLLKAKDDVRKDARLLEFTGTVNRLLATDAETRRRQLAVVIYRVTPLGDSAGVIEWVAGAQPAREVISKLLQARGSKHYRFNYAQWAKELDPKHSLSTRVGTFHRMEKRYPPVLWEWFVETFPEPVAWLAARDLYARSLAVMSMVGYILGLGDRHLDNILFLRDSGSVLHVDFDCLFDKGLDFAFPEKVPFRLTQNFVDALGVVCGYEGAFRRTCELTLSRLRTHEDLLMTVLEAFVHDPVVLGPQRTPGDALARTRDRLRGVSDSGQLSVAAAVEDLIRRATNPENLCQMYHGWAPFI